MLSTRSIYFQSSYSGDLALDVKADSKEALVHARPHDIQIVREAHNGGWLKASILRIHAIEPVVRVELLREDNAINEAELTRERYLELRLLGGEEDFFRPGKPRCIHHHPRCFPVKS